MELQGEVENLALRLFYMENAKEDVRSDIAVMRRAAEKVESEVSKAESEKQKQDLYVDRLIERVDKLKEEIAMYEAQIIAQGEETRAAKEALMEAHMEMEVCRIPTNCVAHLLVLPILCIPTARTHSLGQRSFSYAAPAVWNTLPYKIRYHHLILQIIT